MRMRAVWVIGAALFAAAAGAFAQKLETPLKLVVGYAPGGASDRAARLVADAIKDRLGVAVIVENRTGAGGRLSAQVVKAAPAGENVLLAANPAIAVVAPLVAKGVGYDPQRDFVPVAQVTSYEFALAVNPQLPVRDVAQLIAWLKANPSRANFGVPATGSLPHFFALMLADAAKVSAQVVGYRGSAPLATDLVGGVVPVAIDTVDALVALQASGKVRVIATSGARRSEDLPDAPTLRESGLDLVGDGFNVFVAPASMPPERVKLIGAAMMDAMRSPELRAKMRAGNMTLAPLGPEDTAKMLADYRAKWEPVIRASGFQE